MGQVGWEGLRMGYGMGEEGWRMMVDGVGRGWDGRGYKWDKG